MNGIAPISCIGIHEYQHIICNILIGHLPWNALLSNQGLVSFPYSAIFSHISNILVVSFPGILNGTRFSTQLTTAECTLVQFEMSHVAYLVIYLRICRDGMVYLAYFGMNYSWKYPYFSGNMKSQLLF